MQFKTIFSVALLSLALSSSAVFAHHEGSPVEDLLTQTQRLSQAVSNSWLSYRVKSTVYAFVNEVTHLDGCVDSNPSPRPISRHHDEEISAFCLPQLSRVRQAFDGVNYYLYDAYDVPNVYQAYQGVRQALYGLH